MIIKTLKNLKRAPVRAVAVLLFAAIISMIICSLQASNEAEVRKYEEAYQSVPVTVTVTTLSDIDNDRIYKIAPWVYDLFTEKNIVEIIDVSDAKDYREAWTLRHEVTPIEISLSEYVKDVQVKMEHKISTINGNNFTNASGTSMLVGITSLSCDKQLLPEYGCEITWYDGYDENIFAGGEPVCLIPEDMAKPRFYNNGKGEAVLYFESSMMMDGKVVSFYEYQCNLKIVGTYTAGDEKSVYCPFSIIEQVYSELDLRMQLDSLSTTLADNRKIDEFREKMSLCFIEYSQGIEQSRWGYYANDQYYEFYRYALDINDDNLFDLSVILEDSIKFNRTVTLIVVALSVVAGFLVGFLMIRRRKREIMLMRMVGESNFRVYFGFAVEQMICILLGIAVGGVYYDWNPIKNLAIFAVVYFIGLTLALAIFMSKKLIHNVKEDE